MGTLLDMAEGEGRTKPRLIELVSLAIHGAGNRFRMIPSALPTSVRDRTSTAALAIGSALALIAVIRLESTPDEGIIFFGDYATFGPFASPAIVVYVTWIAAFFTAMVGHANAARWIAATTVPLAVAARVLADANNMLLRPTWTFLAVLIALSILVMAGSPAPGRPGTRWLIGWFVTAAVAFSLPQALINPGRFTFQEPLWLDRAELVFWFPVIAVVIAAALSIAGQRSWSGTVLLIAVPFTAAAVLEGHSSGAAELAGAIALAALGMTLLLRVFGFRIQLQRLPHPILPRR